MSFDARKNCAFVVGKFRALVGMDLFELDRGGERVWLAILAITQMGMDKLCHKESTDD
ncbi:hypothetical protein [Oceanimonas smirnovii]|uniref:hypothetical protein n=1 Tax=Oceanimonas smirnovii TaxID=264574 RepID=UPI003FCF9A31